MSWYTRGSRPGRNLEAALFGGAEGFFEALAKGERRPLLHALTRALGAGDAMSEHRLRDRARANERNSRLAKQTAQVMNKVLDAAEAAKAKTTQPALAPASPYECVVREWNDFVAKNGSAPQRMQIRSWVWNAMSPLQRQALIDAAQAGGTALEILQPDPLSFWDPRG